MTEEEQKAAEQAELEKAKKDAEEKRQADLRALQEGKDKDLIERLVKERVEESLKDIKSKLDGAYSARDEALKEKARLEQEKKEAEMKRLEEEGKHKELYEMKLEEERKRAAEEKAKREALEARNTELTRDVAVRDALNGLPFRNQTAAEMAFKEITGQLVNKDGVWVHRSGISVKDFVKAFSESTEQSFLFQPKSNSGAGSGPGANQGGTGGGNKNKVSLFDLPQSEVLAMAARGELPNQRRAAGG